jgi:transposase-like protein
MKDQFVTIARFQYSSEAQIVKGKLQSEDIPVFLKDQVLIDTDPLISRAVGGIKLDVRAEDEARAREILDEIETYSVDDAGKPLSCPECGSSKVVLQTSIKDLKSFLAFLFSFLTFALPVHTSYTYHCESCRANFIKRPPSQLKREL